MTTEPTRFRTIVDLDGHKSRHKVVVVNGVEGFVVRWTGTCTGCTEYVEGQLANGPHGCEECGYHGVRRNKDWVPFNFAEYEKEEIANGDR